MDTQLPWIEGFAGVEDVREQFREPTALEGCEVLYATYGSYGYDGYAVVVYRDAAGELWEVEGSHCSCNGLEEQWAPGRVTPESLAMYKRNDSAYPLWSTFVASLQPQASA